MWIQTQFEKKTRGGRFEHDVQNIPTAPKLCLLPTRWSGFEDNFNPNKVETGS